MKSSRKQARKNGINRRMDSNDGKLHSLGSIYLKLFEDHYL